MNRLPKVVAEAAPYFTRDQLFNVLKRVEEFEPIDVFAQVIQAGEAVQIEVGAFNRWGVYDVTLSSKGNSLTWMQIPVRNVGHVLLTEAADRVSLIVSTVGAPQVGTPQVPVHQPGPAGVLMLPPLYRLPAVGYTATSDPARGDLGEYARALAKTAMRGG